MERYADIVLPLAQPAYTYAVADGLDVEEGQAVAVQFGVRRIYTGIVWRIHGRRPDFPRIKTVSRVLYDRPLLDARQRDLWYWNSILKTWNAKGLRTVHDVRSPVAIAGASRNLRGDREAPSGNDFLKNAARRRPLKKKPE